jgi:hypothetical protein
MADAAAAAATPAADFEPAVACKLLLTAAKRGHKYALHRMAGMAAMQQHVDAATFEAVLKHTINTTVGSSHHVSVLLEMPAAQQRSSSAAQRLRCCCLQQYSAKPAWLQAAWS